MKVYPINVINSSVSVYKSKNGSNSFCKIQPQQAKQISYQPNFKQHETISFINSTMIAGVSALAVFSEFSSSLAAIATGIVTWIGSYILHQNFFNSCDKQ